MATILVYVLILAAPTASDHTSGAHTAGADTAGVQWIKTVTPVPVTHTPVTPVTHLTETSDTIPTLPETSLVASIDSFDWAQAAARILQPVVEEGYAFARLSVTGSRLSFDTLILETVLYPGHLVTVTDLVFSGEYRTNPGLLAHLARFSAFTYSTTEIESLARSFADIDCQVLSWQLAGQDSTATLHLYIKETSRSNRINAGLGYSGEEGVTGLINLGLYNLFGGRRELAFNWFRLARNNLAFSLTARDPYPFRLPFGVEALSTFRSFDDRTYHLDAGGEVFIHNRLFEVGLGYSFEQDRSDSLVVIKNLGTTRLSTDIGEVNLRAGQRKTDKSYVYLKSWAQGYITFPLWWGFSFSAEPYAGLVTSPDSLLASELIPAGGARSIRGYAQEEFGGEIVLWSRQELRWGTPAFYLYPLYDIGWVDSEGLLMGYGAGISVLTPIGRLGLDAALPWQGTWTQAKLHLSLVAEF